MNFTKTILPIYLITISVTAVAQKTIVNQDVDQVFKTIKADDIKKDIAYLADDKLKGRLPGTEGYQLAVDYVVSQLKAAHIEPAGEKGAYIQSITLRKATVTGSAFQLSQNGKTEIYTTRKDYTISPDIINKETNLEAPVVFAGYGITAPSQKYDDFAGLDVKGKIILIVHGTPAGFPKTVALSYVNPKTILANALKHGAVGIIIGSTDTARGRAGGGSTSTILPDGRVASSGSYLTGIKLFATINGRRLNELLNGAGLDTTQLFEKIKQGTPASKALGVTVKANYSSAYKDVQTYNVIGKVSGSDAQLKNEYIIHTAHLDHIGIGKPIDGDSIYNGAHDNASGVACLLAIAKLYSGLQHKPKRSALFTFVTGEEMGLLGSAYYVKSSIVPLQNIVADINSDMPTIIAPFLSAVAIGSEHSTLVNPVNKAGQYLNIAIENDPEPEQNRFTRSDQFSFVSAGIPSIYVKYGNKTSDGKNNLDATVKPWRAKYYHKPQDDINGIFDFDAGVTYSQFNFLIGYLVAQEDTRPQWNPGSAFDKTVKP
jgi:hypothetical protein